MCSLSRLDGALTVRTETGLHVFFGPKPFIERAVPSGIRILVDQLLVVELLQASLNHRFVLRIRRPDEGVIRDIQLLPESLKLRGQLVAVDLWIDAGFGGRLLHFLTMFIEAGEKKYLAPAQAPVARQHVCRYGGVGMTDMRDIVDIVNRGGDVKRIFVHHSEAR